MDRSPTAAHMPNSLVPKLIAAEFVTTPSARSMRVPFERILETFPVVIRGPGRHGSGFRGAFDAPFQKRGMAMQVTPPRSPEQNGCVERCRRTWRKMLCETSSVAPTLDGYKQDARRFVVHHNPGPMPQLVE